MTAREASSAGRLVLLAVSIALAMGTVARNREYRSGLQLAQTVIERFPTAVAHHVLAVELLAEGRRGEAMSHLYQAIPEAPRAYHTLGIELFKEGKLTEAIQALKTFVREQPELLEAVSARQLLGHILAAEQRWPEVIEQYSQLLAMNPTSQQRTEVTGLRSVAYIRIQAYADAIRDLTEYLQARPNDTAALTNMGIALVATDRLAEAIVAFRHAVDLDPRDGALQMNLANALFDNRDVAAADPHARLALDRRPDDPAAHNLVGRILAIQARWPESIVQFEAALRLNPAFTDARTNLTKVLKAAGGRRTSPLSDARH